MPDRHAGKYGELTHRYNGEVEAHNLYFTHLRVWVGVLPRAALWPGGRACPGLWSFHRSAALLPTLFLPETKVWHKAPKARKNTARGKRQLLHAQPRVGIPPKFKLCRSDRRSDL